VLLAVEQGATKVILFFLKDLARALLLHLRRRSKSFQFSKKVNITKQQKKLHYSLIQGKSTTGWPQATFLSITSSLIRLKT
jgi:hypothetical protein